MGCKTHLTKGGVFMASQHTSVHTNSGWVLGFTAFAGVLMVISGLFQFIEGLAAVLSHDYFVVGSKYAFHLDATTWGWINLTIGAIVALAGFSIFAGSSWGRVIGIILAIISAIGNFFFIPYAPIWSILIITLDIFVIFALSDYTHSDVSET